MEQLHSFGAWVRRRRRACDLTQRELAHMVGCALGTLKKIETDQRRPSKLMAERLATCLALPEAERFVFLQAARAEIAVDQLAVAPLEPVSSSAIARIFSRPRHNLPAQPTVLVGRAEAVAELRGLVCSPGTRLVTLTGPGGVGKTRLAIQAASEVLEHFPDGIAFVGLASIADASLVAAQIAHALGVQQHADMPLAAILQDTLREQRMLLVLDNFEHVLAAAMLVAELLAAAPGLKILITSREIVQLRGEQEFVVVPLDLPSPAPDQPAAALLRSAAVQLFVARARDVRPRFNITSANATAVAAICLRLEGLPLAIELAARRIKVFEPEALLARLSSRLAVLTGGARDLPLRQQTLRNTIAWSYDLLSAAEQRLYRQLSVFAGGWSLTSATSVCANEDADIEQIAGIEEMLIALTNKSLVRLSDSTDDGARWTMLETVREHAREQLAIHGEYEWARRRHAQFFLQLAEQADPELWGPQQAAWLRQLQSEHDNIRAVLSWDADDDEARQCRARISAALAWFWQWRGHRREGAAYLRAALTAETEPSLLRAKLLYMLGHYALESDVNPARAFFEESLAICRAHGDVKGQADVLYAFGHMAGMHGSAVTASMALFSESLALYREAGHTLGIARVLAANSWGDAAFKDRCEESLALYRSVGHVRGQADVLRERGRIAHRDGEHARAIELFQLSLDLYRELQDEGGMLWTLLAQADVEFDTGQVAQVASYAQENVDLASLLNDRIAIGYALQNLAKVELLHNHALDRSRQRFAESIAIFRELGSDYAIWQAIVGHARVAVAAGQPALAARWCAAVEALSVAHQIPAPIWTPEQHHSYQRALAAARAALEPGTFQAAWESGCALSLAQLIAETDSASMPTSHK
jgi:predicted ATPase/transcriptional regulator with XRE-family HTH domain